MERLSGKGFGEEAFRYLKTLYDSSGQDTTLYFKEYEIATEAGVDHSKVDAVCTYLNKKGLLEWFDLSGLSVGITTKGIDVILAGSLSQSTPDFPVFVTNNTNNIDGGVSSQVQVQIQQSTDSSTQVGHFNLNVKNSLKEFLELLEKKLPELKLDTSAESELKADITSAKGQLSSSKPKSNILRECFSSIKRILENAGGSLAAELLLKIAPLLLLIERLG